MPLVQVYDLNGRPVDETPLPRVFETPIRPDVIKRAVLTQQSHRRQPQGRDPRAGKRTTAESMGTGYGIARMARVKGSRHPRAQQAAFVPSAVGGRRTHPPKAEKRVHMKINKKERRLGIRSAIAATADKGLVSSRGHIVESVLHLPLVVTDDIQEIDTAREMKEAFSNLGVLEDVLRAKDSLKIRAGRGKMRGRRRRHSSGPLLVVGEAEGVERGVNNFMGVDVATVGDLNAELLAPGACAGRLTVWTASALRGLDEVFG